jgi:hypothetical protein
MLLGYARVSTDAQSLEAKMAALKAAGCERIYAEKRSGAETDRKALAKLMKESSPGDTVVVTRLDRLARSTRSAEPAGSARSGQHRLQVTAGDGGRHHLAAGAAGGQHPGLDLRVRARADPRSHDRGPQAGSGKWREVRPQVQAQTRGGREKGSELDAI